MTALDQEHLWLAGVLLTISALACVGPCVAPGDEHLPSGVAREWEDSLPPNYRWLEPGIHTTAIGTLTVTGSVAVGGTND